MSSNVLLIYDDFLRELVFVKLTYHRKIMETLKC